MYHNVNHRWRRLVPVTCLPVFAILYKLLYVDLSPSLCACQECVYINSCAVALFLSFFSLCSNTLCCSCWRMEKYRTWGRQCRLSSMPPVCPCPSSLWEWVKPTSQTWTNWMPMMACGLRGGGRGGQKNRYIITVFCSASDFVKVLQLPKEISYSLFHSGSTSM